MPKILEHGHVAVYGHFSQPPRGNPLTRELGVEEDAAPFHNWNARIADRCYRPNAEAGNFRHISFSFSESLLHWLAVNLPAVYDKILYSDSASENGQGNALATAYHHGILPLARRRDKRTQILWGITAFEQRFGRKPLGFWLPEMAVDTATLKMLADCGIQYTILSQQQIRDYPAGGDGGPYKIALPGGDSIAVFVRDDALSSEISFNIHNLGGAGHWARNTLGLARKSLGPLLLLATEGETFGHHYAGEDQFLHWLMTHEAQAAGYAIATLDTYFSAHPPTQTVSLYEPSSWSDQRGLASWATGQVSVSTDTTWKGALRRALDNVASELDLAYEEFARSLNLDPWELRNAYALVLASGMSEDAFLEAQVSETSEEAGAQLKALLQTQELGQRMYNSYTFTNDTLDSRQPRYAIACAATALTLAQQATGRIMSERLIPDLTVVTAANDSITGSDILRDVVEEFGLELELVE